MLKKNLGLKCFIAADSIALAMREKAKLNQRKLGEMLGVSHQTIKNREKGIKGNPWPQISFLAKRFDMPSGLIEELEKISASVDAEIAQTQRGKFHVDENQAIS